MPSRRSLNRRNNNFRRLNLSTRIQLHMANKARLSDRLLKPYISAVESNFVGIKP